MSGEDTLLAHVPEKWREMAHWDIGQAVRNNHPEACKLLLDSKSCPDRCAEACLELECDYPECATVAAECMALAIRAGTKECWLECAPAYAAHKCLQAILQNSHDIQGKMIQTAFMSAVDHRQYESMRIILEQRPNLNRKHDHDYELFLTSLSTHFLMPVITHFRGPHELDAVALLVRHKADIHKRISDRHFGFNLPNVADNTVPGHIYFGTQPLFHCANGVAVPFCTTHTDMPPRTTAITFAKRLSIVEHLLLAKADPHMPTVRRAHAPVLAHAAAALDGLRRQDDSCRRQYARAVAGGAQKGGELASFFAKYIGLRKFIGTMLLRYQWPCLSEEEESERHRHAIRTALQSVKVKSPV